MDTILTYPILVIGLERYHLHGVNDIRQIGAVAGELVFTFIYFVTNPGVDLSYGPHLATNSRNWSVQI